MTRALITVVLIAVAASHFGAPTQYSIAALLICWYLWPLMRRLPPAARRARRALLRTRRAPQRRPARPGGHPVVPPSAIPALTQINHHHHYYGHPAAPMPARPDLSLRGLPYKSEQQLAHDAIYTTIDGDDV